MLNLLAADIIERFYAFMWPMLRISALMLTAPILSQNAINTRLRILIALVLTWLIYPLHRWPQLDPSSAEGLLQVFNQVAIGATMGLVMQIVVAAVVLGGTNILGGRGRYIGTVAGVILIVLLQSILSVMQMPEALRQIIYGVVIISMLLIYGRGDQETG